MPKDFFKTLAEKMSAQPMAKMYTPPGFYRRLAAQQAESERAHSGYMFQHHPHSAIQGHWKLSDADREVADKAWPGQGLMRFHPHHEQNKELTRDMVHSEISRAHQAYPEVKEKERMDAPVKPTLENPGTWFGNKQAILDQAKAAGKVKKIALEKVAYKPKNKGVGKGSGTKYEAKSKQLLSDVKANVSTGQIRNPDRPEGTPPERSVRGSGAPLQPQGSLFAVGAKHGKKLDGYHQRTIYSFGGHWPVAQHHPEHKTLVVNTHDYGGQTKLIVDSLKREIPQQFPKHRIVEVNHPDYQEAARVMRSGNLHVVHEHLNQMAGHHQAEAERLGADPEVDQETVNTHLTAAKKAREDAEHVGKVLAVKKTEQDAVRQGLALFKSIFDLEKVGETKRRNKGAKELWEMREGGLTHSVRSITGITSRTLPHAKERARANRHARYDRDAELDPHGQQIGYADENPNTGLPHDDLATPNTWGGRRSGDPRHIAGPKGQLPMTDVEKLIHAHANHPAVVRAYGDVRQRWHDAHPDMIQHEVARAKASFPDLRKSEDIEKARGKEKWRAQHRAASSHAKRQRLAFLQKPGAEEVGIGRLNRYMHSIGLHAETGEPWDETKGMGRRGPNVIESTHGEGPHRAQLVHEAGHALQTPAGHTIKEYQEGIGQPGDRMAAVNSGLGREEETKAKFAEAGVERRSGLAPFKRLGPEYVGAPGTVKGRAASAARSNQKAVDLGINRFDPKTGEKHVPNTPDVRINLRAEGMPGEATRLAREKFKKTGETKLRNKRAKDRALLPVPGLVPGLKTIARATKRKMDVDPLVTRHSDLPEKLQTYKQTGKAKKLYHQDRATPELKAKISAVMMQMPALSGEPTVAKGEVVGFTKPHKEAAFHHWAHATYHHEKEAEAYENGDVAGELTHGTLAVMHGMMSEAHQKQGQFREAMASDGGFVPEGGLQGSETWKKLKNRAIPLTNAVPHPADKFLHMKKSAADDYNSDVNNQVTRHLLAAGIPIRVHGSPKTKESLEAKIKSKRRFGRTYYGPSDVMDAYRGRISVLSNNLKDIDRAAQVVRQHFEVDDANSPDYAHDPNANYGRTHLVLRVNGAPYELQIGTQDLEEYVEPVHDSIYKNPKADPSMKAEHEAIMGAIKNLNASGKSYHDDPELSARIRALHTRGAAFAKSLDQGAAKDAKLRRDSKINQRAVAMATKGMQLGKSDEKPKSAQDKNTKKEVDQRKPFEKPSIKDGGEDNSIMDAKIDGAMESMGFGHVTGKLTPNAIALRHLAYHLKRWQNVQNKQAFTRKPLGEDEERPDPSKKTFVKALEIEDPLTCPPRLLNEFKREKKKVDATLKKPDEDAS